MRAARCDAKHDITGGDRLPIDDRVLLYYAHGKSGEIVFAGGVHTRHFGGLAADQRTIRTFAAVRNSFDDRRRDVDVEPATREIVEEEQRLRTLDQDVVHAHRHEIDAHRVVPIERERKLQLRADAVGAGDEHRMTITLAEVEQRTEAADSSEDFGPQRTFRERLDPLDQRVAGIDVDAGLDVRKGASGRGASRRHESVRMRR